MTGLADEHAGFTRRSATIAGLGLACAMIGARAGAAQATPAGDGPVIELRQYKIVHGKRDAFVALFDRMFVESQEAEGMRLIGQFRDTEDVDRFVWIREFPSMPARKTALTAFYSGAIWQANRGTANPMLYDNDNVLMLRPSAPGRGFAPAMPPRAQIGTSPAHGGLVIANICYLWKPPEEGFSELFETRVRPALEAAGLPVLASYVPEPSPNNFPRLPVRTEPRLFVWFTRAAEGAADNYDAAMVRLQRQPNWLEIKALLDDHLERAPQVLKLAPTPRSALR